MRLLLLTLLATLGGMMLPGCNGSGNGPATLCDTTCLKDTIRFKGQHSSNPVVMLSASQCMADTLIWSYEGMGVNRKIGLKNIMPALVPIQASHARCVFDENKKAWLLFNDCATGRGYQVKLPYDKRESISIRSSGINPIDPKFNIAPDLMAYTDRGNIYVEHVKKGTSAMMTFKEMVPIDYDHIHDHIDSVMVSPTRIWVRVKIQNEWKELQKEIDLESIDK